MNRDRNNMRLRTKASSAQPWRNLSETNILRFQLESIAPTEMFVILQFILEDC